MTLMGLLLYVLIAWLSWVQFIVSSTFEHILFHPPSKSSRWVLLSCPFYRWKCLGWEKWISLRSVQMAKTSFLFTFLWLQILVLNQHFPLCSLCPYGTFWAKRKTIWLMHSPRPCLFHQWHFTYNLKWLPWSKFACWKKENLVWTKN